MKSKMCFLAISVLLAVCSGVSLSAGTVSVKDTVMVTYPFSDPDPVPGTGLMYPYWKYRGFTTRPENRSWKMVVLENPYLRVKVFPEVGGKVWSIFDKTSGREMFYDNDVVKFREIAMRGPWTSGGIEFNYGVIGHAPTCAAPVDWRTEAKADGSVSCYISASELLSRSRWTVEINLPADAVWVRTSSVWHNGSPEYQPYYNWANSAVATTEDMMLIYPAENAIGHSGDMETYPVSETGADISYFRNQAYGADKSYHMVGSHKPFFGAYYPGEDRGVMHYSLRDEKLGRKYFCWAQSDQGNIWIDLLTDSRPQYVEMQSGRLYNQNRVDCSRYSAYRQIMFNPYGTDNWSDYWMPFSSIGPADEVNLYAVSSVRTDGDRTKFGIYPLRPLSGVLAVTDSTGKVLFKKKVALAPAQAFSFQTDGTPALLKIGDCVIWRNEDGRIDRPQERHADFNRHSVSGQVLFAKDMIGMREYRAAEEEVDLVLAAEAANLEALGLKSFLLFRRMKYEDAYAYSSAALSVDHYDPGAGYFGGLAALELGKTEDAMDRFEVAAIADSPLRTACYTELARIHFVRGDVELAADYARKALKCNADNVTATRILCLAGAVSCDEVSRIDPMDHFAASRSFLEGKVSSGGFWSGFREELGWEACLELALFYDRMGLKAEAVALLKCIPSQNVLTSLWVAYLSDNAALVAKAERCSLDFVFPFRRESAPVLEWALQNGGGWKTEYLLAMLEDSFGYSDKAAALLCREDAGYAPYYAYRYKFTHDIGDLKVACALEPDNWMYLWQLCRKLVADACVAEAVALLEPFCAAHPQVLQTNDALVDAYIALGRYAEADALMETLVYLPYEGQRASHDKYKAIKLHLASEAMESGDLESAAEFVRQARLWPARLGAGKPYDELIDDSDIDTIDAEILTRLNTR